MAYLKRRGPETIKDPHTLALVCNALLAVDEHNADAGPYLDRLEAMKQTSDDGKFAWWEQPAGIADDVLRRRPRRRASRRRRWRRWR